LIFISHTSFVPVIINTCIRVGLFEITIRLNIENILLQQTCRLLLNKKTDFSADRVVQLKHELNCH